MAEREQRVTPLELFFDLVFVFTLTQVTNLMSDDPTWGGLGRGLLILAALWWAWSGYAWLTNAVEPEEGPVRAAMVGAMAAMLVVALAVPHAFDEHGVVFGGAYLVVRLLHLQLYLLAGKRDADLLGAIVPLIPAWILAPAILFAAGFFDGRVQIAMWIAALGVDYLGALRVSRGGWSVSPAHFTERYGLIVIIALGESIVAIGIGAAAVPLTPGVVTAAVVAIVLIAALWWAYFDVYAVMAHRQLESVTGVLRARLARDYYSYLHLPMIAGVVLFALGLKKAIEHVGDDLATVPAVALCGGLALFYFSHVLMRIRSVQMIRATTATTDGPGWFGVGRPAATLALAALTPVATAVPALAALTLVTLVCCAVIAYDVIHYREERREIRDSRP